MPRRASESPLYKTFAEYLQAEAEDLSLAVSLARTAKCAARAEGIDYHRASSGRSNTRGKLRRRKWTLRPRLHPIPPVQGLTDVVRAGKAGAIGWSHACIAPRARVATGPPDSPSSGTPVGVLVEWMPSHSERGSAPAGLLGWRRPRFVAEVSWDGWSPEMVECSELALCCLVGVGGPVKAVGGPRRRVLEAVGPVAVGVSLAFRRSLPGTARGSSKAFVD